MKEPITARDLFVISTICTGFGVLLSWGLFYRWGSAPQAKPFDAPAWVQAIGSIVGILVAIAVPAWQRFQQRADARYTDDLKARSLASVIFRGVKDLEQAIQDAFDRLAAVHNQGRQRSTLYVGIPDIIYDHKDRLYILGEPGSNLLRAMYYLSELVDRGDGQWEFRKEHFDNYETELRRIQKYNDSALSGLHELMG